MFFLIESQIHSFPSCALVKGGELHYITSVPFMTRARNISSVMLRKNPIYLFHFCVFISSLFNVDIKC